MELTETISAALPAEICGCCVSRALIENESYLAVGPGSRQVVLKKIDPDCLLGGALHPSVRDRLSRVRELAHASVANLFGVEREGEDAYLMWEYVEGMPFDYYSTTNRTPREVAAVARELVLAVDLLHMQGIVHGALIGSNVLVAPGGAVRLTHVSPLLFMDPSVDVNCLWDLIGDAARELGERGGALAAVVIQAREQKATLRQLSTLLGVLTDTRDLKKAADADITRSAAPRRRALLGAAVAAVIGLAIAWGVWRAIEGGRFGLSDRPHLPLHTQAER